MPSSFPGQDYIEDPALNSPPANFGTNSIKTKINSWKILKCLGVLSAHYYFFSPESSNAERARSLYVLFKYIQLLALGPHVT